MTPAKKEKKDMEKWQTKCEHGVIFSASTGFSSGQVFCRCCGIKLIIIDPYQARNLFVFCTECTPKIYEKEQNEKDTDEKS